MRPVTIIMKRFITAAVLLVALAALAAPARAGFGEGMAAYERGDHATALREWRPLAEQGNLNAQLNLGFMYGRGGVTEDDAEAVRWYRKAAEQGDAEAQGLLGVMYSLGKGVAQDYVEAHIWLNVAASRGNADAAKGRDILDKLITPTQVAEAQRLAREWKPRQHAATSTPAPKVTRPDLSLSPQRIARIQRQLAFLGYDPGPADGVHGPKTRAAIRAFEAREGLQVTGDMSQRLVAALRAAKRAVVPPNPAADASLFDACKKLDLQAVKAALAEGANPNATWDTNRRFTPLGMLMASMYGAQVHKRVVEIAETLFANGAELGPFDRDILFFPISEGNERLVALLLDNGANSIRKVEGYTPIELAVKYGQKRVYDLLVSLGGIPVDASRAAQIMLVHAAGVGDLQSMKAAVAAGAELDTPGPNGETALINAVRNGVYRRPQAEAVWWLLAKGADPNREGNSRFRELEGIPLHIFVAMNSHTMNKRMARAPEAKSLAEETLVRLLEAGAKVSGMDSKRKTPLHWAAKFDNVRAGEILIREGARVMAKDQEGRTPLEYAESAVMIKLLKASGASPGAGN